MPLPTDLTTIQVTGTFQAVDGTLATGGTVTFDPGGTISDSTGKAIFDRPATATVENGAISVQLPATDNANLNPTNFSYTVTEKISGASARTYTIQLPSSLGPSVDLSELAPVAEPPEPTAQAGGDLNGTYPNPFVISTHLTDPLPVDQGGTGLSAAGSGGEVLTADGNGGASWQPAGTSAIGGDLTGSLPNPEVTATHLAEPLPVDQGGTGLPGAGAAGTVLTSDADGSLSYQPVSGALMPAAVQTAAYNADPGDLVPCDITGGSFTVTLPQAPPAGTTVAVMITAASGGHALTVAAQGADTLNTAGGPVAVTLSAPLQAATFRYSAGYWYTAGRGLDWLNVRSFGARGDGSTDDTAAIQAALNACAAAGGGTVYIPPGQYTISSALTWTAASPLEIAGAGTGGHQGYRAGSTAIRPDFAPGHVFDLRNSPWVRITDLDIFADGTNSQGATADYVAVYTSGVNAVQCERMQVAKGTGNFSVNSVYHFVDALGCLVRNVFVTGEEEGVWVDGGGGATIEDTFITTTAGNRYGAVRMDNTSGSSSLATIQMSNLVTFRGDWAFYGGGSGNSPTFIYANNVQVNNPRQGGFYFQAGSQVWCDYVWISMSATPSGTTTYGLEFDTGFQGWAYVMNSVIQHPSGHGAWIKGGQGFVFDATSFGGCGNSAANTYDDLHVASGVSNVTVTGCHFDVDKYNGIAGNKARSAVYLESGVTGVNVAASQFASGYGTAPIVNNAASGTVSLRGNLGYNPVGLVSSAPAVAGSGTAVTNTTGVDCTVIVTVSASGGATSVAIGGHATGITSSTASAVLPPVRVPAGQTITLTYSNAPTWTWWGD